MKNESPRLVLLDNYDSFSYNIVELLASLGRGSLRVKTGEELRLEDEEWAEGFIFSPGAGAPDDYPQMKGVLARWAGKKPILGICLGHQAIAEFYGARLFRLSRVKHGQREPLFLSEEGKKSPLFSAQKPSFAVGLYHSWAVEVESLPSCLEVWAWSAQGLILAMGHEKEAVFGVQYHPESFMSEEGAFLLNQFLEVVYDRARV